MPSESGDLKLQASEEIGGAVAMQEALARGVQAVKQLDRVIREELRDKPEVLAEWDEIMREYADILAEDEIEAEEKKLDKEIRERMDQLNADVDRILKLDALDLEVEEAIARNFASMHEFDAIMRDRCRDYPEKLAKWEEVMESVNQSEAIFEAAIEAEKAQPEN